MALEVLFDHLQEYLESRIQKDLDTIKDLSVDPELFDDLLEYLFHPHPHPIFHLRVLLLDLLHPRGSRF